MKKIISTFLAVLTIFTVFPLSVYATVDKPIFDINVIIDEKIIGKTPADWAEFISVNEESIKIGNEGLLNAKYVDKDFWQITYDAEVFEEGIKYYGDICLYAQEGYYFPDENHSYEISIKINGQDYNSNSIKYIYNENRDEIKCISINVSFTPEKSDPTGIAAIPKKIGDFFMAIITFITEKLIQPIVYLFI